MLLAVSGFPQDSPFVPPHVDIALRNEISGDIAYDNLRLLTQFHRPEGSIGLLHALQFLESKARAYGLQNVRIHEQPYDGQTYEPILGELWMIEPRREKLASTAEVAISLADYSRTTHLTAELIDVGDGDQESDYEGKEVKGKIVLAAANPGAVMPLAVWKFGAAGLVCYNSTRIDPMLEAPDQVAWSRIPFKNAEGKEGTFAFILSPRQGLALKNMLSPEPDRAIFGQGRPAPQKVVLKVDIETKFHAPRQWYLEALIPGTAISDQDIVLTGHAQEEKFSANDDGSGCVNVLEIGRALTRLIKDGTLPRPRRNIRLWWTNEISSEYRLWQDRPKLRDSLLVNLNQDMVGAKQSIGSRVQHITRPPLSRHGFLGDVVESIAAAVINGNNAFLSGRLQGTPRGSNFSKPMYSRLGTREPYNARVVPYFDFTDHLPFLDGPGGIPAITLTNWPDEIIHSSDDELWNIDRTQLKRNAYIVAATAWYLANAGDTDIPQLAGFMYSLGKARLGHAFAAATQHLSTQRVGNDIGTAYREARVIVEESYKREREALATIAKLANDRKLHPLAIDLAGAYEEQLKVDLRRLDDCYLALTGKKPVAVTLTAEEKSLAAKVPKNNPNLRDYFAKRDSVRVGDVRLNPHIHSEVWNFIDGRRSVLDIYHAVFAETMVYGQWYYGTVSLADVKKLVEAGVEKGVLRF
jgi:hypothetical protein